MSRFELPEGYVVKYVHARRLLRSGEIAMTGGQTIAKVLDADGEQVAEGIARCRSDEHFNKALGREISLGRALAALAAETWPDGSEQ